MRGKDREPGFLVKFADENVPKHRMPSPKVIIVGAGSTGLLLAQGLKQNGVLFEIYEREDSTSCQTRPREWGMTLHWGASYISKCLPAHLASKLNEGIACDPFYHGNDNSLPIFNAGTGQKLFDMPGVEPRRVSRKKLRNFLSRDLDILYGKLLVTVDEGSNGTLVAGFADGCTTTGDVIVGCDGAHSVVREFLVGKEAAKLDDIDLQMLNVSCTFPKETALLQRKDHPIFKNAFAKINGDSFAWWQSIQDVQNPDEPGTWRFQNVLSWTGFPRPEDLPDREERLQFWRERAGMMADPWRSVGRDLPEDLRIVVDRTTTWTPTDWTSAKFAGRITLAGDAAHPMPPFRGQGLNQALQDASDLVDEFVAVKEGGVKLGVAVTKYESAMRERALTEMPVSMAQALMIHNFDTLMEAPFFKHGMNKYRELQEASGAGLEVTSS